MSKIEKLIARVQLSPADFTWQDLAKLLSHYGFEELNKGKTAGSRRAFVHAATRQIVRLHKPHPGDVLKQYQLKEILELLNLDA